MERDERCLLALQGLPTTGEWEFVGIWAYLGRP